MSFIQQKITESSHDIVRYKHAPRFAPAGQSTQMIVGATPETDYQILHLSESLYKKYSLKRVFFSAYMPVSDNPCSHRWTQSRLFCGAPALPGGLATAVLRLRGRELLDEQKPQF